MNFDFIVGLEKMLLDSSIRNQPAALERLLADDFVEFGTSGRIYDKKITIERLSEESPVVVEASNFEAKQLSPDVVQLTFKTRRKNEDGSCSASLRSSLWKLNGQQWQMFFHQGTKTDVNI